MMDVEWFLQDGRDQFGPLSEAELRQRVAGYDRLDRLWVWRDGFDGWKTAAEALKRDAPAPPRRAKFRWALYGAIPGVLLNVSDILFQQGGPIRLPWYATGRLPHIGDLVRAIVPLMIVGFVVGTIRDWRAGRAPAARHEAAAMGPEPAPVAYASETPKTHRFNNFIARNWRGEFSLPVSYWVFGILGSITIALVPIGLGHLSGLRSEFDPMSLFVAIVGIWLAAVVISVWQWVGVWRSAGNYIAERHAIGRKAPWGGVAKLMVILGFLQLAATVLSQGIAQVSEATRIAFFDDPDIPDYSIRLLHNGTEVEITGGIKYGLADELSTVLRASRQIRVVHLNSVGGRIGEGEKLYRLIKDGGLTTYVSLRCMSACTVVFSGGRERILRKGAVLGFHRGSFAGQDEKDSLELLGQRKVFQEAGYNAAFISRALATPSSDIWKPSAAELLQAGVITQVSDGSNFALSGLPVELTRSALSNWLAKDVGAYGAIRDRFPARFDEMIEIFYNGAVNGDPEQDVNAKMRAKVATLLDEIRLLADDDVLVDLSVLTADQIDALAAQSPADCYEFVANGVLNDSRQAITRDMTRRQLEITERLIRTATKRPPAPSPDKALWTKFAKQLVAKGFTRDDFDLLERANVSEKDKLRFCRDKAQLYREAAAFPQKEAAMLVRALIAK